MRSMFFDIEKKRMIDNLTHTDNEKEMKRIIKEKLKDVFSYEKIY